MATLYEWKDMDGDHGDVMWFGHLARKGIVAAVRVEEDGDGIASVYLTRKQAKKLRKALKRALVADLP